MRLNPHAIRATLDAYGLTKVSGEDLGLVARGRTPFKPLDPAMQRLRDAQGVNMAFEDNAQIDPTNPNPEPGVIHRADDGADLEKEAGALVDLRAAMAAKHRKWGLRAVLMAAHMGQPQAIPAQAPTLAHTALLESFGRLQNRARSLAAQDYIYKVPDLITKTGTVSSQEKQVRRGMAWVYRKYAPKDSPLYAIEDEAKASKRGLWVDADPAGIGTTWWTDALHAASLTISNNLDQKRFANGANASNTAFRLSGYGRGAREIELVLTVAKTAATMAEARE